MTTIKHTLQNEIFIPDQERLVSVVNVSKDGKRKKTCFLCGAVTTDKPVQVTIYKVKKSEKGEQYKKKISWPLRQVKLLDAKYKDKDSLEFDLVAEKVHHWEALNVHEKNSFIQSLWKLSHMYLLQKPEFVNIKPGLLDETQLISSKLELEVSKGGVDEEMKEGSEEWKGISEKEQSDLETLMSQCQFAVVNAEAFILQLTKDLSVLDGANIHSIMGSEYQVRQLMTLLDQGIEEAEKLEGKLNEYESMLEKVKDSMEVMKDKEAIISINNHNNKQLLLQLQTLLDSLIISDEHMKALQNGDLSSPKGVRECTLAFQAIVECHCANVKPALEHLSAVKEQRESLKSYEKTFTKRLSHHLNSLFIRQSNEHANRTGPITKISDLRLPSHSPSYRQLLPYSQLIGCLRTVDPDIYQQLKNRYVDSLSKLFEKQLSDFVAETKQFLSSFYQSSSNEFINKRATLLTAPGSATLQRRSNTSLSAINTSADESRLMTNTKISTGCLNLCGDENGTIFEQIFEQLLTELEVWCGAEEDLCINFFNLQPCPSSLPSSSTTPVSGDPWVQHSNQNRTSTSLETIEIMTKLFTNLEFELLSFHSFALNLNHYNSVHMLVRTAEHVLHTEDTGSYVSKCLASLLVNVKRSFDKLVKSLCFSMRDYKPQKKSRVGLIPFVFKFEEFVVVSECVFKGQTRRNDLDKAYKELIETMFQEIDRVALESFKIPSEVVKLENYHKVMAVLSGNKISSLESSRKDARKKYSEALQDYTSLSLGQPLEKVYTFFQGIETKVASGVRFEDVGFQAQYSRQELKRNLKEYPGKEVKKGLEHLYKRVVKHLSEDTGLLQVVWHSLQDEFIKQYKSHHQMIERCYPGSNISFEFTIEDLLSYFSQIAQSH